jgi:hypothetical protein
VSRIAVLLLVVLVAVWFGLLRGVDAAPAGEPKATAPAAPGERPGSNSAALPNFNQGELPTDAALREVLRAPPWLLSVLAVDCNDDPVAGATITYAAVDATTPFASVLTGADGTAQQWLEHDQVVARAAHAEVGASVGVICRRAFEAKYTTRLVLGRPVVVRGMVLGADAAPLADAEVRIELRPVAGLELPGFHGPRSMPRTDAGGHFTIEALAGLELRASLQSGKRARWETVRVGDGRVMALAAAGALRVRGSTLVQGAPVAAKVTLMATDNREPATAPNELRLRLEQPSVWQAQARAAGSRWSGFDLDLPWSVLDRERDAAARAAEPLPAYADFDESVYEFGTYAITAYAEGVLWPVSTVEVSLQHPRAQTQLAGRRVVISRGMVEGAVGRPAPPVLAVCTDPQWQPRLAAVDARGRFEFSLPSATTWVLAVEHGQPTMITAGEQGIRLPAASPTPWADTAGTDTESEQPLSAAATAIPTAPAAKALELTIVVRQRGLAVRGMTLYVRDANGARTMERLRGGSVSCLATPGPALIVVRRGGEELLRRTVAVPTHLPAQLALDLDD